MDGHVSRGIGMPLNENDRKALGTDLRRVKEAMYYENPTGIAGCGFIPCGVGVFEFGPRTIVGHPLEDQQEPWRFDEMPTGGKLDVLDTYIDWNGYRERGMTEQEERAMLFAESREQGHPPIRDTTLRLVEAVRLDAYPTPGAMVDFGIDSQRHYEALYYPIRAGEITAEALDVALGHGGKLTELARSAASNPHKDIEFRTSWDELLGRPRPDPGTKPASALSYEEAQAAWQEESRRMTQRGPSMG